LALLAHVLTVLPRQSGQDATILRSIALPIDCESKLVVAKTKVMVRTTQEKSLSRCLFTGVVTVSMDVTCDVSWSIDPNRISVELDESRQVLTVRVPSVDVEAVDTNTESLFFSVFCHGAAFDWLDNDYVAELKDTLTRRIREDAKIASMSCRETAEVSSKAKIARLIERHVQSQYPDLVVAVK
jgi:hypothetical protein